MSLRPIDPHQSPSLPPPTNPGLPDRVNRFAKKLIPKLIETQNKTPKTPFTAESLIKKLSLKQRLIHWIFSRIFGKPYKNHIELSYNQQSKSKPVKEEGGSWGSFSNKTSSKVENARFSQDGNFHCFIDSQPYISTQSIQLKNQVPNSSLSISSISINTFEQLDKSLKYFIEINIEITRQDGSKDTGKETFYLRKET